LLTVQVTRESPLEDFYGLIFGAARGCTGSSGEIQGSPSNITHTIREAEFRESPRVTKSHSLLLINFLTRSFQRVLFLLVSSGISFLHMAAIWDAYWDTYHGFALLVIQ
jgi:hypothetical protein